MIPSFQLLIKEGLFRNFTFVPCRIKQVDIRWTQRFSNFNQALSQLESAVELARKRELTELEKQGLIQAFEFTHELAWNVIKDYFIHQGNHQITGSRDAIRTAFNVGLIEDGEAWMETIKSRNKSSHTYNEETANESHTKLFTPTYSYFKNSASKWIR